MIYNIILYIITFIFGFISYYIYNKKKIYIIFPNINNILTMIYIDDNKIHYKYKLKIIN